MFSGFLQRFAYLWSVLRVILIVGTLLYWAMFVRTNWRAVTDPQFARLSDYILDNDEQYLWVTDYESLNAAGSYYRLMLLDRSAYRPVDSWGQELACKDAPRELRGFSRTNQEYIDQMHSRLAPLNSSGEGAFLHQVETGWPVAWLYYNVESRSTPSGEEPEQVWQVFKDESKGVMYPLPLQTLLLLLMLSAPLPFFLMDLFIFRQQQGCCWRCGYNIRGLSVTVCPECGSRTGEVASGI